MFTTRVELHHASDSDYTTLHQAMEAEGFARVIKGSNGVWYHMPHAEYDRTTTSSIEEVRLSAQRAATKTGRSHSVFVTEAVQRAWIGLPLVQYANR